MVDKFLEVDGNILLWIQDNLRCDFLTPIVKGITYLGNVGIIWILACIVLLIIPKTRKLGIVCSCSLAAAYIVDNIILKNLIARTRPYEVIEGLNRIIEAQSDYSFPSGHSGSSFAVAVVMFKEMPEKFGVPALVLAILIALSRLYVGVHYPSDVLCGIIFGTVFALISCYVYHRIVKDKSRIL